MLMPMVIPSDKGEWTYLGQVASVNGAVGLTFPADVQQGDFGLIIVSNSDSQLGGTPPATGNVTLPSGWTDLATLSTTGSVTSGGLTTSSRRSSGIFGRTLTPALAGTSIGAAANSGNGVSRLYMFRNSKRRPSVLTLLDAVSNNTLPSRVVSFGSVGSPVIAGLACIDSAGVTPVPTYNGSPFPASIDGPSTTFDDIVFFALQRAAADIAVASTESAIRYRAFAVGTQ